MADDVRVHHRGARGVDGILRLIELAASDAPLEHMLTSMCDQIAAIAGVEITSVYVRDEDHLVMRGNHGFPREAIGATKLAVGEGITGLVAECMRPVSAARAAAESSFKLVPGLGEEEYPVFVGVPLIGAGAVIGVLVLQRKQEPFSDDEVTLATALGAPVTLAIERRRANAMRSARLQGRALSGGVVLGRAGIVPTSTAIAAAVRGSGAWAMADLARAADGPAPRVLEAADIERASTRLKEDLGRAVKKLADVEDERVGAALDRFSLALLDQRLRERLVATGDVRSVVKEYMRAQVRLGEDDPDRVSEIEELVVLLGVAADQRATAKTGAVWLADRAGTFVAIAAVARGAAALVTSDSVSETAIAIARAARLPLVCEVPGLWGWTRPGDLLAVDGDDGTVLVHPAASDVEKLRRR